MHETKDILTLEIGQVEKHRVLQFVISVFKSNGDAIIIHISYPRVTRENTDN